METKLHSSFCILPSSFAIVVAITLECSAPRASAQIGQWGTGFACYAADPDDRVYAVALQADGKAILGGVFKNVRGCPRSSIARLNSDGSLDGSFDPGVRRGTNDAKVLCLAVQTNGQILLGGYFNSVCGTTRTNIARLNADGSIDPSFYPAADDWVQCLAVQTNGQILVGGWFTTLGGEPRAHLARLNSDGKLDDHFTPGADGDVLSLAVQADQKIVVGGSFTTLGGQPRTNIGRLETNGILDPSITSGAVHPDLGGSVLSLAIQTNGQILVGGVFNQLGTMSCTNLGRLFSSGIVDDDFNPRAVRPPALGYNGCVNSLAVQADGQIVVGGEFTTLCGQSRTNLGRVNSDGGLDTSFNPVAGGSFSSVECLALRTNGQILVGGWFATLCGQSRNNLGRLMPDGSFDMNFNPPAIAGPVYPPPWGVGLGQSGGEGQIGRAAGAAWFFTNNPGPLGTIAFWGATNGGVKLSFDNSTYTGQEILTYRPELSSLASGQVVWAGQTTNPVSKLPVYTRFVLTVTNQATGTALPLFEAGSLRLPTQIGGLVLVTNNSSFKAVLSFQASTNVIGPFMPALEFFDTNILQKPQDIYSAYSSFGAGFYYLTNSFALNRIIRLQSATNRVEIQFQDLPGRSNILQCSTNLTTWRQVTGAVVDVYGVVPFVDQAPPKGRAFYRVRCP